MPCKLRPAAFIDRDGVINTELNYVSRREDFHVLPGVLEGLKQLRDHGFALFVVTNQAGIAKGRYDEADFHVLTRHMLALFRIEGIVFDAVYYCPHHPDGPVPAYARPCDCRKPAPGMLLRAATEHCLDLSRSVLIGDKVSDTQAGRAAGLRKTVLVESGHVLPPDALKHADHRCKGLLEASAWLCTQS